MDYDHSHHVNIVNPAAVASRLKVTLKYSVGRMHTPASSKITPLLKSKLKTTDIKKKNNCMNYYLILKNNNNYPNNWSHSPFLTCKDLKY